MMIPLTALLTPVTDVDNFSANTSFEVVTKSFETLFVTFFGIFRGGAVLSKDFACRWVLDNSD
jgi:hypothetical protein